MSSQKLLLLSNHGNFPVDLELQLKARGYSLFQVGCAFEAGQIFANEKPQFFIIDINMSEGLATLFHFLKAKNGIAHEGIIAAVNPLNSHQTQYCKSFDIKTISHPLNGETILKSLEKKKEEDVTSATNQKVLIVDDDDAILEPMQKKLNRRGYQTDCASNGSDVIGKMLTFSPDVVITDIMMPEVDGYETVNILLNMASVRSGNKKIKIVVMSGNTTPGKEWNHLLNENNIPFITKPINFPKLIELLEAGAS